MTASTTRPPFDPEILVVLRDPANPVVTALAPDEIDDLRQRTVALDERSLTLDGRFSMHVHRATGPAGAPPVPVVLWLPAAATEPVPVLCLFHGGGLVVGTPYDDIPAFLSLAAATGFAVASVDYRLAPEHPYPAAVEDCYAALVWLTENATGLGLAADHVVVTGVSAGGGLAAATVLAARDRGGPPLAGQLLVCPMLDDRNDTASAAQMAGHGAWDRNANATGWAAYLGDLAGGPGVSHLAAPARATDLTGLPPTFIDVGSAETFRDEDVAYAQRIWQAGGRAELHVWPGGSHAFDFMAPDAALSKDARHARMQWLTRTLAQAGHRPADRGGLARCQA